MQINNLLQHLSLEDTERLTLALSQAYPADGAKCDLRCGWKCEENNKGMYLEINYLVNQTININTGDLQSFFAKIIENSTKEKVNILIEGIELFIENAITPYKLMDCSSRFVDGLGTVFHSSLVSNEFDTKH